MPEYPAYSGGGGSSLASGYAPTLGGGFVTQSVRPNAEFIYAGGDIFPVVTDDPVNNAMGWQIISGHGAQLPVVSTFQTINETVDRRQAVSTATLSPFVTGQISGFLIYLPQGAVAGHIFACPGTTVGVAPSHSWYCLYDLNGNALAVTVDKTTVYTASTPTLLAIADTYSGGAWHANTTLTLPYTGYYYVGWMVAQSPLTLTAIGASVSNAIAELPPALITNDTTVCTTPTTAPATILTNGTTGVNGNLWMGVTN